MFFKRDKIIRYKKEFIIREKTGRKIPRYLYIIVKSDQLKDFNAFYNLEYAKKYIDMKKEENNEK